MKNCLGIEIGHYRIKIAYAEKGELKEFISERVQGMDLTDMHVCADLIKDLLKEYAIRCRNVVFVIRQEDVYVRRFEMPLMTEEQLRLNLPYEFHDYIGDEMDKYVFDYAMIQTKERTMDLLGAACTKTLSQQFEKLAKMARLKLVGLVPAVLGLERILEYAQERKDYAVLDLGTQALRIHFFREGVYDITRTMEPGCEEIEQIRSGDKNKMQELGIEAEEENREETEKEKKKPEFSEEELRALQQYLDELPETETPSEEETAELYRKAAEGDSLAKSMLVQLWLPKVIETAKEMHTRDFFLMDLVQEGNVGLLVALESVVKAETAEQAIDAAVRETISDFMEEHRVQKHKDNTVVNKVNRLKDAIEELSDGDDMDFSVAELSAYLDMSVEEIEDILRIAGEEP